MNKIILIGRITADPELRYTNSNVPVVQFTLAVSRNFKNQNGETEADFIKCVGYRKTAELISTYIRKGNRLAVDGRLQVRTYDKEDGTKVTVSEVVIDAVEFVQDTRQPKQEAPKSNDEGLDVYATFGSTVKAEEVDNIPFSEDSLPF